MSHIKNEFNQKYAGRSRVRRDLNDIKDRALREYTGPRSGNQCFEPQDLSGGVKTAYLNLDFTSTSVGHADGKYIQSGPLANFVKWNDAVLFEDAEASICIWRGPRDFYGRDGKIFEPAKSSGSAITILNVNVQVTKVFTGVTELDLQLFVARYGSPGNNLINSQVAGGAGTSRIDLTAAAGLNGVWPKDAGTTGSLMELGINPGWGDNSGGGGVLAAYTHANALKLGLDKSDFNDADAVLFQPGLYLNLRCNNENGAPHGTQKINDITAGTLGVTIIYNMSPF
jgi:hypothetical protein